MNNQVVLIFMEVHSGIFQDIFHTRAHFKRLTQPSKSKPLSCQIKIRKEKNRSNGTIIQNRDEISSQSQRFTKKTPTWL